VKQSTSRQRKVPTENAQRKRTKQPTPCHSKNAQKQEQASRRLTCRSARARGPPPSPSAARAAHQVPEPKCYKNTEMEGARRTAASSASSLCFIFETFLVTSFGSLFNCARCSSSASRCCSICVRSSPAPLSLPLEDVGTSASRRSSSASSGWAWSLAADMVDGIANVFSRG
jgi:hypothetical protein